MTRTEGTLPVDAGLAGVHSVLTEAPAAPRVPELDGVLSAQEVLSTAASIAEVQRHDGMIPWFEGGHCDPWNHVESAMALTVGRPPQGGGPRPTSGWPTPSSPTGRGSTTTWPTPA